MCIVLGCFKFLNALSLLLFLFCACALVITDEIHITTINNQSTKCRKD